MKARRLKPTSSPAALELPSSAKSGSCLQRSLPAQTLELAVKEIDVVIPKLRRDFLDAQSRLLQQFTGPAHSLPDHKLHRRNIVTPAEASAKLRRREMTRRRHLRERPVSPGAGPYVHAKLVQAIHRTSGSRQGDRTKQLRKQTMKQSCARGFHPAGLHRKPRQMLTKPLREVHVWHLKMQCIGHKPCRPALGRMPPVPGKHRERIGRLVRGRQAVARLEDKPLAAPQ